jgi:hypothetical protein
VGRALACLDEALESLFHIRITNENDRETWLTSIHFIVYLGFNFSIYGTCSECKRPGCDRLEPKI